MSEIAELDRPPELTAVLDLMASLEGDWVADFKLSKWAEETPDSSGTITFTIADVDLDSAELSVADELAHCGGTVWAVPVAVALAASTGCGDGGFAESDILVEAMTNGPDTTRFRTADIDDEGPIFGLEGTLADGMLGGAGGQIPVDGYDKPAGCTWSNPRRP